MPQLFVLYPDLTAHENVNFVASLFGIPPWRRGQRVEEVLSLVDLWDARNRRASQMSGGMQRRLELACALVHQPALLILDEPTAGIDPMLQDSDLAGAAAPAVGGRDRAGNHPVRCRGRVLRLSRADLARGTLLRCATPGDLRKHGAWRRSDRSRNTRSH